MHYSPSHEWVKVQGDEATIGVSSYFQKQLEDIVHVELPKVGHTVKQGEEIAVLESTKAAIDVITPVSGTIIAVNHELVKEPNHIKHSPEQEGWIAKIKISHPSELTELLDPESYHKSLGMT